MQTALQSPRRELRALALVLGSRILAASPSLAELTGYTRGELTSPEFRLGHIFGDASPALISPGVANEIAADRAQIAPLRGEPFECDRVVMTIQPGPEPLFALVLSTVPLGVDEHGDIQLQAAREVVRAYSSQLASILLRVRQVQLRIEDIEHAAPQVVTEELRRAGAIIEALERLEADVETLSRAAGRR